MNWRRAAVLLGVLAIAIGAWMLFPASPSRETPKPAASATQRADPHPADSAADASARLSEPPTPATIAASAERGARLWTARADAVTRAKNARMFNADVARMMALPADEAWAALVHAARDGDLAAGAAALLIAQECERRLDRVPARDAESKRVTDREAAASLPPEWARFLATLETRQEERLHSHVERCADVGGMLDFALLAMDNLLKPDDPGVQVAEAETMNARDAIATLRALAADGRNTHAMDALGRRLIQFRDPRTQAEGRALLEQLANEDPNAVDFLASCYARGCGGFAGDPMVADAWSERAAGMGAWPSLGIQIAALDAAGDAPAAWAWALYRLELATLGCFEIFRPQSIWIAPAAEEAFARQATLSPAQQAAGRITAEAIARRWQAGATARFDCG